MDRESEIFGLIPQHGFEWKTGIDWITRESAVESQRNGRKMRKLRANFREQKTIIKARMGHVVKHKTEELVS